MIRDGTPRSAWQTGEMPYLRTLKQRIDRMRGDPVVRDLGAYASRVADIGALAAAMARQSGAALRGQAVQLGSRVREGEAPDALVAPAFALVRETARRTLGLRPYDVQIIAGLALHDGRVAEQATGEGKTLSAVAPMFLNALRGRGAHVLTFNDYLARRDAVWMGPAYEALGLTVGVVQEGMEPEARRAAYACDVTYLTAKEMGFDLLRDDRALEPAALVHRELHYAIVDEADSILIDEARVPLVIAGATERLEGGPERMAALVRRLGDAHWEADEDRRAVSLTDAGISFAEAGLGLGNLTDVENLSALGMLNNALHAELLLERDVDYIVRGGRVEHVDEFTGRVVDDRQWPDGLQAALEAKEGVRLQREGRILGQITLQHALRRYPRLAGMTATAQAAAHELREFYELEVVVVPPHRPCIRRDEDDLVFTHADAKRAAVIDAIGDCHASSRPVLVGTASVRESEGLAAGLRAEGVQCEVLNARTDEHEAQIVAQAGARGAVTISTNMAGRGTDIRLGGVDGEHHEEVVALGGLVVLGTNRHESIRIDDQLRGRAGRQGDPGSSRFFVSLEDPLIARFGVRRLIPAPLIPAPQAGPIDDPVIRREIARTQRIIDGQNLEIRRTLFRYAGLLEEQRRIVQRGRRELMLREAVPDLLAEHDPVLREQLVAAAGQDAVNEAERRVTLHTIDECWAEHLAEIGDLREGIHLIRMGGRDPLAHYQERITQEFLGLRDRIAERVLGRMAAMASAEGGIDLAAIELKGPSATWTYLINDEPFRDALQNALGRGGGFAVGAAFYWPLLLLWQLARRWKARREGKG